MMDLVAAAQDGFHDCDSGGTKVLKTTDMRPLYEDPHVAFHFADDRIIPRFPLENAAPGGGG
jgi:hypothetical protein